MSNTKVNNQQVVKTTENKKRKMVWKVVVGIIRVCNFIYNLINFFDGGE